MPDLDATSHGSAGAVARELRALATQITSLQADIRRLESAPLPRESESGWDDSPPATFGWISSLEPHRRAGVRVPRLPLELAFLAGTAALAGLAHLRPLVIAGVMGAAWAIVVLAEWVGSRGDRLRQRLLLETPVRTQPEPEAVRADPTWFTPPVEHTLLARPAAPAGTPDEQAAEHQKTTIAKLPSLADPDLADPDPADPETTAERRIGG